MVEVHESGCRCRHCVLGDATILPWRTGSQVGRTIYVDPRDGRKDPLWLIGTMDTEWWAQHIVDLHNEFLGTAQRDGSKEG
jgi:hypothetical protein